MTLEAGAIPLPDNLVQAKADKKDGPHKLLALDGGGIRGVLSLEILSKMESLLQKELDCDDSFVLANYFDYIAGTSTGGIISTCLALGMRVSKVRNFYLQNAKAMFDKASVLKRFRYKFEDKKLSQKLQNEIGADTTLGSDKLMTLLMLVMRNATTDSPWPISNNPKAKYNLRMREDGNPRLNCNLDLPLWQIVRASTAAPTFFPPEVVKVGNSDFIFVDGGITMYNNPSFQLFLMATVEPYNLKWQVGEKNMLLVSVGTGMTPNANENLLPGEMNLLYNATSIPSALMSAAQNEQDFLCRVFGRCLFGDELDREVGDMVGKNGPVKPKLFTYLRYDAELSAIGLGQLGLTHIKPEYVQQMDSVEHIPELQEVGRAIANQRVNPVHFKDFLS